jgi:hypothetical protein
MFVPPYLIMAGTGSSALSALITLGILLGMPTFAKKVKEKIGGSGGLIGEMAAGAGASLKGARAAGVGIAGFGLGAAGAGLAGLSAKAGTAAAGQTGFKKRALQTLGLFGGGAAIQRQLHKAGIHSSGQAGKRAGSFFSTVTSGPAAPFNYVKDKFQRNSDEWDAYLQKLHNMNHVYDIPVSTDAGQANHDAASKWLNDYGATAPPQSKPGRNGFKEWVNAGKP